MLWRTDSIVIVGDQPWLVSLKMGKWKRGRWKTESEKTMVGQEGRRASGLDFWETRHTWRFEELSWDGETLRFRAAGAKLHGGLRIVLPARFGGKTLENAQANGAQIRQQAVQRYDEDQMLVEPLDLDGTFSARYTAAS